MHHCPQRSASRQNLRDFAGYARLPRRLELRPQRACLYRSGSNFDAVLGLSEAGAPLDRSSGRSDTSHHVLEGKAVTGDVSLVLIGFDAQLLALPNLNEQTPSKETVGHPFAPA